MNQTDLLATIVLNNQQAHLIRMRFHNNPYWKELAECFPAFNKALELLPDTSKLRYCNVMLQDMVMDTIKLFGLPR